MRRRKRLIERLALSSLVVCMLPPLHGGEALADEAETSRWLAPAPRLANGRFANPSGPLGHGDLRVRLGFMLRRMRGSFGGRVGAPFGPTARDAEAVPAPRITWIGHATVLVEMDGVRFLTDPIWSDRASPVSFAGPPRLTSVGLDFDALPRVDFVVISHSHFDHLDLPTLERLAARDPLTWFVVPLGNGALLRESDISRVIELDWTETTRIGDVEIHCLPAKHWSKRSLRDDDRALWSSWAVIGPSRRFYYAGDTGYFPGFAEIGEALGPFDLAALPIGAYAPRAMMRESHMNPEEAWRAASDLRARAALGVHYGTFDLSDEPSDEPPQRFQAAAGTQRDAAWVVAIGESRTF